MQEIIARREASGFDALMPCDGIDQIIDGRCRRRATGSFSGKRDPKQYCFGELQLSRVSTKGITLFTKVSV